MGVRIALGATAAQILGLILRDALATSAVGCVIGVLGSVALVPILAGQLFGVRTADAIVLMPAVAMALTMASVLASWWPARRATVADPLESLRSSD
jgi:ABC-type antimicrobial peptide transport system permease subunit